MPIVGPSDLDTIVELLRRGQVVAIPTDTVYGLAARADNEEAVRGLAELKGRDPRQPIAVLFDKLDVIRQWIDVSTAFDRLSIFWPGALTLIETARPGMFAPALTPSGAIGVRQPAHDLARDVIRRCGGVLAVTSANRHGERPAATAEEVAAIFGEALYILDGGSSGGAASTVVDLTADPPKVLREGPLTAAQLGLTESENLN